MAPAELAKTAGSLIHRAVKGSPNYVPGKGAIDPTTLNNQAFFALFGLLGAGFVLTGIWFFFWAKNGGFRWRKGDWEDYKSTVLRRKGPNGTTLSGATKTTVLGGGSVVGSQGSFSDYGDVEKGQGGRKGPQKAKKTQPQRRHDEDIRAYRNEKAARVGGLNRAADGSYNDFSPSDISGARPTHKQGGRDTIKPVRVSNPLGRQNSFSAGTEAGFSATSDDSHRPLNSPRQHNRHSHGGAGGNRQPSRQHDTLKRNSGVPPHRSSRHSQTPSMPGSMPGSFTDPLDMDRSYAGSDLGSDAARNTRAYIHPIPGLSSGGGGPSRGFRRGVNDF